MLENEQNKPPFITKKTGLIVMFAVSSSLLFYLYTTQLPPPPFSYRKTSVEKTKRILFYNRPGWVPIAHCVDECPIKSCVCSDDPSILPEADAVIIDLVGLNYRRPPTRYPNQVWVAFGLEAPPYYENANYASDQWRDVFNWTMTYRLDSDIVLPYSVVKRRGDVANRNFTEIALRKSKAAAWMVSNCRTPSKRRDYVKKLQQYYSVDVYGDCGTLSCKPDKQNCIELLEKNYRFYIAFENSLCKDYITEKLYKTFGIDIVPVVRGGADYNIMIPAGTYINTADYASPKKLAEYLQYLENNITAYSEILRRKSQYISTLTPYPKAYCDICMRLHNVHKYTNIYYDTVDWLQNGMCYIPTDLS